MLLGETRMGDTPEVAKGPTPVTLPVKDLGRSKEFFTKLGFSFDEQKSDAGKAVLLIGEDRRRVLLIPDQAFKSSRRGTPAAPDTPQAEEVLVSFEAGSREEVDVVARQVFDAGGRVLCGPDRIEDSVYGCGFADLDGHRWNVRFTDFGDCRRKCL
jgi:predicted lactoylglutathione lyase